MKRILATHPLRVLAAALIGLALLAFLGYLLIYLNYAAALFRFPFDYDQGEGFELMDSLLFSRGEWPYRDNSEYPFYSSNYPPLFHLLVVPLIWLFGPQYWTGRLVSLLATLLTAATIGWVVQRGVRRPWLAALCGLAFLASNYVYHVGPLFRMHMTMVMFETLAIAVIGWAAEQPPFRTPDPARIRAQGGPLRALLREPLDWGNRGVWLGLALLLAAGFTKQTAIVTCAAAFAFFALRGPKRALALALPFSAVTLVLFGAINLATDGQWWLNTIVANVNPWIMEQAVGLYRQWFRLHAVITVLAIAFALYELYRDRLSIFTVWFVTAVIGSVMAGKWGAGESYFATAIAASCMLAGLATGRALQWAHTHRPRAYPWLLIVVPFLFLLQARLVFHMPTDSPLGQRIAQLLGEPTATMVPPQTSCSPPQPARPIPYVDAVGPTLLGNPPTAADIQAGRRIAAYIQASPTPALSEEAGFSFYAGADIVTNPTQLRNLYLNNMLEMGPLLEMVENQGFGVIIFRAQFYPDPVLAAIGRHYRTVDLIEMNNFVYCVLHPRDIAAEED
jgi:4-amino-4-deoxy-L-arabinose transferase-like glycosyltransferase